MTSNNYTLFGRNILVHVSADIKTLTEKGEVKVYVQKSVSDRSLNIIIQEKKNSFIINS